MALKFGNSASDRVAISPSATTNNLGDFTRIVMIKPNAANLAGGIMTKGTGGGSSRASFELRSPPTLENQLFGIVDLSTTDADADSVGGVVQNGVYQWVAMTFNNTSKVIRLFHCVVGNPIAEVSYFSQATGSGTRGDDSGNNTFIGCYGAGTSGSANQDISTAIQINRVLNAEEINAVISEMSSIADCSILMHLGMNGTGTQADLSGNLNNGTVTGATLASHAPIGPLFGYDEQANAQAFLRLQSLSATLTSASALSRESRKVVAGTLTLAGALSAIRTILKDLGTATLATAGGLTNQAQKVLAGTASSAGALTRQASKILAGDLTSAGALAAIKTVPVSLAGTLTTAGALVRSTGKVVGGTVTTAGSLVRQTARSLAGTLTTAGAMSAIKTVLVALTGALTSAGSLVVQAGKALAGTVTPSGDLVRLTGRSGLTGTMAPTGALSRSTQKVIVGVLATIGGLTSSLLGNLAAVVRLVFSPFGQPKFATVTNVSVTFATITNVEVQF